jgi:uncharacterized Zn-binding protein involved in type VI secretion
MSRGDARLNDKTIGNCAIHGPNIKGKIITASTNVITNGKGTARLGDKVRADCGHVATIISASSTEFANGKPIARLNDKVGESPYTAEIITASTETFPNQD